MVFGRKAGAPDMTRLNSIPDADADGRHLATKVMGTGDAGRSQGKEDTDGAPEELPLKKSRPHDIIGQKPCAGS